MMSQETTRKYAFKATWPLCNELYSYMYDSFEICKWYIKLKLSLNFMDKLPVCKSTTQRSVSTFVRIRFFVLI